MNDTICKAISQRRLLQFNYGGSLRVVAPYCHGISHAENESLRAIQVRGDGSRPKGASGKMWTVTKMSNVTLMDERFEPDDPNYNPDDSAMKIIHCRI